MKSIASTSWYVNENGSIDSSVTRARTQLRSRIFLSAAINLSTFLTKSQLTQMSSRVRHRYKYFKHKRRQYTFLCQKYLLTAFFCCCCSVKSLFWALSFNCLCSIDRTSYCISSMYVCTNRIPAWKLRGLRGQQSIDLQHVQHTKHNKEFRCNLNQSEFRPHKVLTAG